MPASVLNRPRVLVVEDDTIIGMCLVDLLKDAGFQCTGPVRDLVTALYRAENENYDVALLDIVLLDTLDYRVMEVLDNRGIPFGFLSATVHGSLPPKWRDRPFLEKPCSESDVVAMLNELLYTDSSASSSMSMASSSAS